MGWLASILVAMLSALAGCFAAGAVAVLAVDWYEISSFEGESGFFVVGIAMLGAIAGAAIGLIVSRVVAARPNPGPLKALGVALGMISGVAVVIGGAARLLADVPPRLGGDTLLLAVEVRWPAGSVLPAAVSGEPWTLWLRSSSGRVVRASKEGPLWREDARFEDGHWIVPGAVQVFTSRGERSLDVEPAGLLDHGFLVPLPAFPGRAQLQWSEWLPRARDGEAPLPEGFRYRFRVVPSSQAVRVETFGPFEVETMATDFFLLRWGSAPPVMGASARFAIKHRGNAVAVESTGAYAGTAGALSDRFDAVAALPGARPALVALTDDGVCHLVADAGERARVEAIAVCGLEIGAAPLTAEASVFVLARDAQPSRGRFDRDAFSAAEQFLFPGAVLDLRDLSVHPFDAGSDSGLVERIAPLDVSPDGASFVRLAMHWDQSPRPSLVVITPRSNTAVTVPIDAARTRLHDMDLIDPAWVQHYFAWVQDEGGAYRLVERADALPLPYRGQLTRDSSDYREYRVAPVQESLRGAMIELLVAEFAAEPVPAAEGALNNEVRIGDAIVNLLYSADDRQLVVWMDRGGDTQLVATIAERFDAALRTGDYDRHFAQ